LIELNLLQLSASKASVVRHHPLATRPVMPIISYPTRHGQCSLSMEIVGPYLALLIIFPYSIRPVDKLYIFDWKKGAMLFVRLRLNISLNFASHATADSASGKIDLWLISVSF
jgi:hypothetical protein